MKLAKRLIPCSAMLLVSMVAGTASAKTYNIKFGSSLTAQITTAALTAGTQTITGITGSFLGSAITSIIADPYSPALGYYYESVGVPQPTNAYPVGMTGIQYYYVFDDLLLSGNTFDGSGLQFETSADVISLYFNVGKFDIAYTPIGGNVSGTILDGAFTITQVAAVPEPVTWAMMMLGLGFVGFAMRRRDTITRVAYAT